MCLCFLGSSCLFKRSLHWYTQYLFIFSLLLSGNWVCVVVVLLLKFAIVSFCRVEKACFTIAVEGFSSSRQVLKFPLLNI